MSDESNRERPTAVPATRLDRCRQQFEDTGDPFFVLEAIAEAVYDDQVPPDWALREQADLNRQIVLLRLDGGDRGQIAKQIYALLGSGFDKIRARDVAEERRELAQAIADYKFDREAETGSPPSRSEILAVFARPAKRTSSPRPFSGEDEGDERPSERHVDRALKLIRDGNVIGRPREER